MERFPVVLHNMLQSTENEGLGHIVSWQPHGRCFVVHKPTEFVATVLNRYFDQTKWSSFQRQLNLYNFKRITTGPDMNGYYHPMFVRNRGHLAHYINRMAVKGTGPRQPSSPLQEPNFYATTALPLASSLNDIDDLGEPPLPSMRALGPPNEPTLSPTMIATQNYPSIFDRLTPRAISLLCALNGTMSHPLLAPVGRSMSLPITNNIQTPVAPVVAHQGLFRSNSLPVREEQWLLRSHVDPSIATNNDSLGWFLGTDRPIINDDCESLTQLLRLSTGSVAPMPMSQQHDLWLSSLAQQLLGLLDLPGKSSSAGSQA